ncbi:MAG: biotin--[acetyl-CoA-carboxylase] ligase [Burkholderiaceae bacterium]
MIDPGRFERVARIDSTNSALMRRPFAEGPQPACALMADRQDAGRGRNGRVWRFEATRSLALSVAVERGIDGAPLLGLPLAVGVVVAECLAEHGAAVLLKWPNDVLVDTGGSLAKAGGILVEARHQGALQRVVIGVGLNLAPSATLDEAGGGLPAGACFAPEAQPDREVFARRLADALAASVPAFAHDGLRPWLARWRARDALDGRPIDLVHGDGRREAVIARGIDDDGALRIEHADGAWGRQVAGEVSIRPR